MHTSPVLLCVILFLSASFATTNYYCDETISDLYCYTIPQTNGGTPAYNYPGMTGYNASAGWVIGQNTVVSLNQSYYAVGNVNKWGTQFPGIYIIENGVLEIVNQGSNEVAFGADIYLCGNATFRIIDSKWRLSSQYQYQYLIWATQNSKILFQGLNFTAVASDVPSAVGGSIGAQWMRGNSTLTVQAGSNGYGITSYRPNDSWELIGIDNTTIKIDKMNVFSEFYVASTASWTISNSRFFDFFFEGCPSTPLSFSTLPPLCDLTGSGTMAPCTSTSVPPINFHTQPTATSFTMNFANVTMFSWAFSVFQGGDITVNNAEQDTNLYFGINLMPVCSDDACNHIITSQFNITAGPNAITGIAPYYVINTQNTSVTGYHMWMAADNLQLIVNTGSIIGDLAVTAGSSAKVYTSILENGSVYGLPGSLIYIYNSTVSEQVIVQAGALFVAERSALLQPITIVGNVSIADTSFDASLVNFNPTGIAHRVLISDPAVGVSTSLYNNVSMDIYGGVFAVGVGFVDEAPFPTATLALKNSVGSAVLTTTISSPTLTNSSLLTTWNLTGISAGSYTITLSFGGNEAVSTRPLILMDWTGASPSPIPSSSSTPIPSSSPSSDSGGDSSSSTQMGPAILVTLCCILSQFIVVW